MAYKRRSYRRKSYWSRLAKPASRLQLSYSACKKRGYGSRVCYKKALRASKNYYPSSLLLPNGNRVVQYLPKPGYMKAILRANPNVIRYVKDNNDNRQIYMAGDLWVVIGFDAAPYAIYNAQPQATPNAMATPASE